jgi:hypothetical protein
MAVAADAFEHALRDLDPEALRNAQLELVEKAPIRLCLQN